MIIQVNNKNINISENTIKQYQKKLELTEDEAIALYLEEERLYWEQRAITIRGKSKK